MRMKTKQGKDPVGIECKPDSSVLSLTSQELLEAALRDVLKTINAPSGFCRGEPLTNRGKRKQMIKMLTLLFIPVLALWCLALQTLSEDVSEKTDTEETQTFIRSTVDIGRLVYRLQKERDLSVFFYTALGPSTKYFLLQEYDNTDNAIANLEGWPVDFTKNTRSEFATKEAFQLSLSAHRHRLGEEGQTLYSELTFYTSKIDIFTRCIYDSIKESKYGFLWRSLVAYVKLIAARDFIGFERSLGSVFFVNGEFPRPQDYHSYLDKYYNSRLFFRTARNFSPLIVSISEYGVQFEDTNLTNANASARREIMTNGETRIPASIDKGQFWYDTMSVYLDILLSQQQDLAQRILELLENNKSTKIENVTISSVLLVAVVLISPLVFMGIQSLTSDIQRFAITLVDKTKELSRKQRKTDSLIYQMVPKPLAEVLKKSGDVEAEYFKDVTVFFF